ncbi:MAG: hypothetical protein M3R27_11240 [Bacteroidota bacterium]|nr:hypothetical protein [Bacteroidota bacterium]
MIKNGFDFSCEENFAPLRLSGGNKLYRTQILMILMIKMDLILVAKRTLRLCGGNKLYRTQILMIKVDAVFFGTPVCTGAGCRSFMKGMITFGEYEKNMI